MLEELKEFLRIPSVSAQPEHKEDMHRCAEWLCNHCKEIGLDTKIHQTKGHPIVVARTPHNASKLTYMVYGHYDVQPVEPLEGWTKTKNPFEPVVADGNIYGRGTADDKGQLFTHLKAVECILKTGSELPFNLIFLMEGEEEIGSENLGQFLESHAEELRCEAVVISDTGMPSISCPAVTYALRGVLALEVIQIGRAHV